MGNTLTETYTPESGISAEDLLLELITNSDPDGSSTVTIEYQATINFFVADTRDTPTQEEVEAVIASGFDGPNFDVYLDLIQNLGGDNAFSGTTTYCYGSNC